MAIKFVGAKKAGKASVAVATRRSRIDHATVPAATLPDGTLAGQTDRRLELR